MAQENDLSLKYVIKNESPRPKKILVLIHGYGSNEADLIGLKIPEQYTVVCPRGIITLGAGSYAWYPVDFSTGKPTFNIILAEKARQMLIQFIKELKQKYHLSYNDIVVGGFSQGGIMSYWLALTAPEMMHGVAVMSGRLPEEFTIGKIDYTAASKLSFFVMHGTNDRTLPISYAESAVSFLRKRGIEPVYKVFSAQHEINLEMNEALYNWLKEIF